MRLLYWNFQVNESLCSTLSLDRDSTFYLHSFPLSPCFFNFTDDRKKLEDLAAKWKPADAEQNSKSTSPEKTSQDTGSKLFFIVISFLKYQS